MYEAMHAPVKQTAWVEEEHCAACGLCISVCQFDAIELVGRG